MEHCQGDLDDHYDRDNLYPKFWLQNHSWADDQDECEGEQTPSNLSKNALS